jgi:hypothetical protein
LIIEALAHTLKAIFAQAVIPQRWKKLKTSYTRGTDLTIFASLAIIMLGLAACAGSLPVPGGSEDVNAKCFGSVANMQSIVAELETGMPEEDVLARLCRKKENLQKLDRRDIRVALLGGDSMLFAGATANDDPELINSLYGYKLNYKNVKREHGFISPIRIRTDESGFNYFITLIFREGALYAKPIVTGGLVNNSSSGTLFDFITPGTIVNGVMP